MLPSVSARLLPLAALLISLPVTCYTVQAESSFSSSSESTLDYSEGAPAAGVIQSPAAQASVSPFSRFGIGVKVGILGIGVEAAVPVSRTLNVRGGANFFSYAHTFTSDGISYAGNLHFRSAEASLDWFPGARGFHISPGALLYNGNSISANATVPSGQSFTLNDVDYTSSAANPVSGNASLTFNKAAPKVTVGLGNMIPRSGRHFSMPFELGFAYVGQPKFDLNLAGTACANTFPPSGCANVATDPQIQSNITAQEQKIQKDVNPARFFPILSVGFAYSFGAGAH